MSDFGYPNARVRAWKSNLFDNAFFEKLMAVTDTDDVTALLSQTPYQSDIEKGVMKYKGVSGVEEGLRINLTKTLQKLLKIVRGDEEAEQLVQLILTRWDIYNLKTVLRGFHAKAEEAEIFEHLIPAGTFDEVALTALTRQPGMKAAIDQLLVFSPQYAEPLREGFRSYKESNNLADLELKLDKFYFSYVLSRVKGRSVNKKITNDVMQREIDFVNLMTLFRLAKEILPQDIELRSFFIEGGKEITIAKLISLINVKDIKDKIEALSSTSYYSVLKKGLEKYLITGSLVGIERALEDYNTRKVVRLFWGDPLSIAIIVAYIWAKINEIINIRIILRGKEVDMPPKEIKEALVFA